MRVSNRMRVMVTGGACFLGSHLCERPLKGGCDLLCVDNFDSGTQDNVAHLMGNSHFELMRHDVTFPLLKYPYFILDSAWMALNSFFVCTVIFSQVMKARLSGVVNG